MQHLAAQIRHQQPPTGTKVSRPGLLPAPPSAFRWLSRHQTPPHMSGGPRRLPLPRSGCLQRDFEEQPCPPPPSTY